MFVISFLVLAIACQYSLAYDPNVKQLTPEQIERLNTWTEDDNQNIWELSGQVEGDMILTRNQRNGLIDESHRWKDNTIPYELDPVFSTEEAAWIQSALNAYAENSCVTVRRKNDDDADFVYVTGTDSGCWSFIGRVGGGQYLNLQRFPLGEGCFRTGTIVHEFLHAAGFFHQQSTHNRDDYVEIVLENIQPGAVSNFIKYSEDIVTNFGEAYDYGSVMHYSAYAFSTNGEMTIIPKDPQANIGQRVGMSDIDISKLNKMYCA